MSDFTKLICRLCLEIIPYCESEPIEEIKKDILKTLLINIDFEISNYAVACNGCMEKVHVCFDFKSHCINTRMDVDLKLDVKKDILQNQLINYESACQENSQVCRLCMSFIGDETYKPNAAWKDAVLLKDMIRSCFPKMDLNTVHEPVICGPCLGSTKNYYEFMKSCQEVERRIKNFHQVVGHGSAGPVILEDLVKFKDYNLLGNPLTIKTECSDTDNDEKCPNSDKIASIKCEEIDIKDELDRVVETSDPDQTGNCDSFGKEDFTRAEENDGEITKKGKKYSCPKCPFSSDRSTNFKHHMRTHPENEIHECFLCPFMTDTKFSLKTHMTSHRGATKLFGCSECPYETNYKTTHLIHLLRHKDESEVDMHKCSFCSYRTKYRGAVVRHLRTQHAVNTIKTYKCKECSYSTKHKNNFASHQLVHLNPEETPMYKCVKCKFQTKYKKSLSLHLLTHEDPQIVNKFKCDICAFRGKRQSDIREHMMVHSDDRPFSCDQCAYSSKSMKVLALHKRVHQEDRAMYKCKLCGFQAKKNVTLKSHMAKSHMDTSVPMMKCAHCPYETTVKFYLSNHIRRLHGREDRMHMELEETCTI